VLEGLLIEAMENYDKEAGGALLFILVFFQKIKLL